MVKAIQDAAVHGMSFPGPSEHEIRLAEILTTRIPTMEVVRFANSGTEATMHAIRVARAFTGKSKIAKFEGAYHGTHDWVLVSVSTAEGAGGLAQAAEVRGLVGGRAGGGDEARGGAALERPRRLREDSREGGAATSPPSSSTPCSPTRA